MAVAKNAGVECLRRIDQFEVFLRYHLLREFTSAAQAVRHWRDCGDTGVRFSDDVGNEICCYKWHGGVVRNHATSLHMIQREPHGLLTCIPALDKLKIRDSVLQ